MVHHVLSWRHLGPRCAHPHRHRCHLQCLRHQLRQASRHPRTPHRCNDLIGSDTKISYQSASFNIPLHIDSETFRINSLLVDISNILWNYASLEMQFQRGQEHHHLHKRPGPPTSIAGPCLTCTAANTSSAQVGCTSVAVTIAATSSSLRHELGNNTSPTKRP